MPNGSNAVPKVPKPRGKGVPFVKGEDPRRNLKGRPRSFDAVRELAQQICHEELITKDGTAISRVEALLRSWSGSIEPSLQKAFVEYAFGKVPDKLETTLEHKTKLFLNYSHESDAREDRSRIPATVSSGTN